MNVTFSIDNINYVYKGCRETSGVIKFYNYYNNEIKIAIEEIKNKIISVLPVYKRNFGIFKIMEKNGIMDVVSYRNNKVIFRLIYNENILLLFKWIVNYIRYEKLNIDLFLIEGINEGMHGYLTMEDIIFDDNEEYTWYYYESDTLFERTKIYLIESYILNELLKGNNPFVVFKDYFTKDGYFYNRRLKTTINFNYDEFPYYAKNYAKSVGDYINKFHVEIKEEW